MTQPGEHPNGDDEQLRHIKDIIDTLGGEVTGGQQDFDRVMPDFVNDGVLGEEELAMLSGGDRDGVPVPYTLQFVGVVDGWVARLASESSSPELMAEIDTGFGIREARYPDTPIWDRMRAHVANELQAFDDLDSAVELVLGMRSKHALARAVSDLTERLSPDDDPARIVAMVIARFVAEPDKTNLIDFLQANYDVTVNANPDSYALDAIEVMIRRFNPGYDSIQSWAESMAKDMPEVNWNGAATIVGDEELWSDAIPLRFRQFAIASHFSHLRALSEEANDQRVQALLDDLAGIEGETPRARIWDQFRYSYGARLLEDGHPAYAVDFGRAMHDANFQQALVMELIEHGAEDDALRLTNDMTDATVMAQTLLDAEWTGDQGVQRLATIVDDDSYPLARRIECIIAIRDRMREFGNEDSAARHDVLIAELRQRLAEE